MKHILIITCLLISALLKAQPYLSLNAVTKGVEIAAGYLDQSSGVDMNIGYIAPLLQADQPRILYVAAGRKISLSRKRKDGFNLTPSLGYAKYAVQDFSQVDKDAIYGEAISIRKALPIFRLEFGKDWHIGRLFVNINYCNKPFYGIGMRAFLN